MSLPWSFLLICYIFYKYSVPLGLIISFKKNAPRGAYYNKLKIDKASKASRKYILKLI